MKGAATACQTVPAAINDSSSDMWQLAVQMELEGIVAKDGSSIYTAGRTTRWQNIKADIGAGACKAAPTGTLEHTVPNRVD
jgi:ATP-dependent DNA ligase